MAPLAFRRDAMLERLRAGERFDVVVIGGGITGAGVALDAASRGLSVALVERDDFASGTSSKSSKLVHGGLRYLQHGDVRLVYEALRERQRLLRNAPHLVNVLPFLIPVLTRDGPVSKKIASALRSALWMYDLTGGLRIGKRHRRLDAAAVAAHCPTLPAARISSGFLYYDAAADDARLTLAIARTAADHGAVVVNRCPVVELAKDDGGRTVGVVVEADGERCTVAARCVVAAAGVWADDVRGLDDGDDADSIRPAKGVHLTLPWELVRNDVAVIVSVPGDKRSLFIVPWGERGDGSFDHVYVGTTDTDHDGPLDAPQCDGDDIDYVVRALDHSLTSTITRDDITGVWAGLRPLVKTATSARTADLSRRHSVSVSESGVISVTGGKLTTYREMAEDTVDEVMRRLGRRGRCTTKRLPLRGADLRPAAVNASMMRLRGRYGSDAELVEELMGERHHDGPSPTGRLVDGLPYLRAEATYAVREEMATTLDDVLVRRTRAHLENRAATMAAAPAVARWIAPELGWTDEECDRQVEAYLAIARAEIDAATQHRPEEAR